MVHVTEKYNIFENTLVYSFNSYLNLDKLGALLIFSLTKFHALTPANLILNLP